ncbi:hypothetical protein SERLA73DRAFT_180884 [Serpula lacrymans var. lacrymans S7.3]|uniref:NAD(P)-binding protein n=2 Tax=Serpula lacrymans var. lacrymans TaxID=341189 RepID=F8PWL3_SERL3|nr:uncharacterized protein SERLADRAFT_466690 [Serpula lacrymans var. lacrymans S7.9]EGO00337.1 hypothetical protein SERLA73DRAFT_180884 [Serpula lacrymans var. lacrymans S7.3]EGO25897.1 hypothetical protein SERLADRAFT_466690 [Serpula lacrymans var. lacrymans S7.9]
MSTISDEELFTYAERIKGKVVVITGAANGIGKRTAQVFAKYGAKIVIGDLDVDGAGATVAESIKAGGEAVSQRCDVLNWDDQVSLFELAMNTYGAVDVVIPNAGVTEMGIFNRVEFKNGKPIKPKTTTLEVNLLGALYTAHLALYYLKVGSVPGSLKAIIFMASMSSWQAIPGGTMYSAAKHGVLGVMRSLDPILALDGIRTNAIHPWFADTAIVPTIMRLAIAGIPLTPVDRIAGAFFYAATDPDMNTSGSPLLLPDDGPVFRLDKEELREGVYGLVNARTAMLTKGISSLKLFIGFVIDLLRVVRGNKGFLIMFSVTASLALSRVPVISQWIRK